MLLDIRNINILKQTARSLSLTMKVISKGCSSHFLTSPDFKTISIEKTKFMIINNDTISIKSINYLKYISKPRPKIWDTRSNWYIIKTHLKKQLIKKIHYRRCITYVMTYSKQSKGKCKVSLFQGASISLLLCYFSNPLSE